MLSTARGGLIERRDVTRRIVAALDRGGVLAVAGAGYGKTTALQQALGTTRDAVAWIRCGDAGADAGRLLGAVLSSVSLACPGAADALAERLVGARDPIDPCRATAALELELRTVLVEPLVIVFDDAETIVGVPAAADVIAGLMVSDSPLLRVAVAARRRLDLGITRLLAGRRVAELGPGELAFSAAECARYVHLLTNEEPDHDRVEALMTATEGWPLGIALAATDSQGSPAGPSPSLADRYFDEEVYSALDPELKDALLAASIAPDLAVAERAGLAPAGGFSAAVDRRELFVSAGERDLHPLFREFLQARFRAEAPLDEQRRAARAIACALEREGRQIDAIAYDLQAREWDQAALAIARHGPELVRTAAGTVEGWLCALPPECAAAPQLQLLAGELAHGQGRFREAIALCRAAVERLDASAAPAAQRFAARFAFADVLMAAGQLAEVGRLADVLDEPGARGSLAARAVGVVAAAGLARQGRFDDGRLVLERALEDPAAALLAGLAPAFEGYYLALPAGRLDEALEQARAAVAALEVADPTGRLAYAMTYLMAILEERGEDSEALAVAAATRECAQRFGLGGWVGAALAIRSASLRVRRGDPAGAEADLAEVPAAWEAWGAWELDATRAAIAAARGAADEALAAAERAAREAHRRWPYFDRVRAAALLAPVLCRAGHPQRARELVERTIAERVSGFSTARLQLVLAWLLHDEGDESGSLAAVSAAAEEAGDQLAHIIRREWPRCEPPIWTALEHGALDVDAAIDALARATPGGEAAARFTRHPAASARRSALRSLFAAGHPDGIERLGELLHDPDPAVAAAAATAARRLENSPPPLTFRLLGGFELRRGTWPVHDAAWGRRVAQRIVRLLLCRGGGPVGEDELIEAFWPDKPADAARRGIQVAVSAARMVLDPPGVTRSRLVCAERSYRLLLREGDTIDADEFEHAAGAALAAPAADRRAALLAAAALWHGEPLPEERYAEWATLWRERLIDRYGEVLSALADAYEQAGEPARTVEVARRLVELDPLNEAAHRRLIVAFSRAGRRGHALRQVLACRRALVTELGVEPSEETAALQRRVLAGEPI
jgi:ATP/maltotriose-dependent transcriptional regulator MalT/DNA-binding SARP family transcriptional activator